MTEVKQELSEEMKESITSCFLDTMLKVYPEHKITLDNPLTLYREEKTGLRCFDVEIEPSISSASLEITLLTMKLKQGYMFSLLNLDIENPSKDATTYTISLLDEQEVKNSITFKPSITTLRRVQYKQDMGFFISIIEPQLKDFPTDIGTEFTEVFHNHPDLINTFSEILLNLDLDSSTDSLYSQVYKGVVDSLYELQVKDDSMLRFVTHLLLVVYTHGQPTPSHSNKSNAYELLLFILKSNTDDYNNQSVKNLLTLCEDIELIGANDDLEDLPFQEMRYITKPLLSLQKDTPECLMYDTLTCTHSDLKYTINPFSLEHNGIVQLGYYCPSCLQALYADI